MTIPSGIPALDERTGGLEEGELHLLCSPPIPARTSALVQFLAAGLEEEQRVALVSRLLPERLFRAAGSRGPALERAWEERRLVLAGFRGEYEARLRRAGKPAEVYEELARLLDPTPARLAIDPATALWKGRGDGGAAGAFVDFAGGSGMTVLAAGALELDGELPLASELVVQAAAGVFSLREGANGLLELSVRKAHGRSPGTDGITLELRREGELASPTVAPARRRTDTPPRAADRMLYLPLDRRLPEELVEWLRASYRVTGVTEPLDLVSRLQEEDAEERFGLILISLGRQRLEEVVDVCRVCRRLRPGVFVAVVSEESLRASDRARIVRAGADQCVTGGLDREELASRLELAAPPADRPPERRAPGSDRSEQEGRGTQRGEDPGDEGGPPEPGEEEGPLREEAFRARLRKALASEGEQLFTVVRFARGAKDDVVTRLAGEIRSDEGDAVGILADRPAVWLADTLPAQAAAFVRRVRVMLEEIADEGAEGAEPEILGSARDAGRLRELSGRAG